MKTICIITPCYNEEDNVKEIHNQIDKIFSKYPNYNYKHLFIDNHSNDNTVAEIKKLCSKNNNVQLIQNSRNFGAIRSPYYGLLQSDADASILIAADLQEPTELIHQFIEKWENGYKIVVGVKNKSKESKIMYFIRRCYYKLVSKISDTKLISQYTGFGLYDRKIIKILRKLEDPYPYLRGLISEIGFDIAQVNYTQPRRDKGRSKSNFFVLYEMAMLGITSNSRIPLRIATIAGFALSLISFLISLIYLSLKLIYWNAFDFGIAPMLIGLFFFSSIQLFFIGMLGEYISFILTRVTNRPLVIEKERINID